MSASFGPLANCPKCWYALTGLPKTHRCPECGFEYEETMRIWIAPASVPWRAIVELVGINILLGGGLIFFIAHVPQAPIGAAFVGIAIVSFSSIGVLLFGRREYILIGNDGLFMKNVFRKYASWQWLELWVPSPNDDFALIPSDWSTCAAGGYGEAKSRSKERSVRRVRNERLHVYRHKKPWISFLGARVDLPIAHVPIEQREEIYATIYAYWKRAMDALPETSTDEPVPASRTTG